MRTVVLSSCIALAVIGCGQGGPAKDKLAVPIYPGAKVTSSGENQDVIGANFETTDPQPKVIKFYADALGVTPGSSGAGNLVGIKNGHSISVIITDAGHGKTAGVIVEQKH